MPDDAGAPKDSAAREQTDASLRAERSQTDRALAERQRAIEDEADHVIAVARDHADAVLTAARSKADHRLGNGAQSAAARAIVNDERSSEDSAVQDEREAADGIVRMQREETARTLRSLIPFEREATDRHLLTERACWDDAVANRDDFLGMVSHDLRGLLGGIVTAAAILSRTAPDTEDGQKAVAQATRIQRYAARMNRLIGDLVDVASIEAGKLSVSPTVSDAAALVKEAADTFAGMAATRNITVAVLVEEQPLQALFDYPRILQVMTNLLSNAVKFTPAGGRIDVRAGRTGSNLQLSVSDSGTGIPEALLEQVFERFWQVDRTERSGIGLGLYICRSIADAHRGHIWAESPETSGTTIYLTLPIAEHVA